MIAEQTANGLRYLRFAVLLVQKEPPPAKRQVHAVLASLYAGHGEHWMRQHGDNFSVLLKYHFVLLKHLVENILYGWFDWQRFNFCFTG